MGTLNPNSVQWAAEHAKQNQPVTFKSPKRLERDIESGDVAHRIHIHNHIANLRARARALNKD